MGISYELARFVCETTYDDLPRHVVEIQKQSVLDGIAIMLGAGTLGDGCKEFVDFAAEMSASGQGQATVIGFGKKLPMLWAAFANASMAHSLDFGDTYAVGTIHPNSSTLPAALAAAEYLGNVSGRDFLTALVVGSEVACRLAKAVPPSEFTTRGFFLPPIFTSFAAAAAAGKLLGLHTEEMIDAFSFNLSQFTCSSELIQNPDTVLRSVRESFGAKAGLSSALLARRGLKGFREPFEGKLGFYYAYFGGKYNASAVLEGLGTEFEAAKLIFKPWPCCMGNHGCINAALELIKNYDIDPEDIRVIHAEVPSVTKVVLEPLDLKKHPQNAINAKFSLPFTVATAIIDGDVTLSSFTPDALRRENVLRLADKITYEIHPEWDNDPLVNMGGRLTIITNHSHYQSWVKKTIGSPENPMSEVDFQKKLSSCAEHAFIPISPQRLSALIERVQRLEELTNIDMLASLL